MSTTQTSRTEQQQQNYSIYEAAYQYCCNDEVYRLLKVSGVGNHQRSFQQQRQHPSPGKSTDENIAVESDILGTDNINVGQSLFRDEDTDNKSFTRGSSQASFLHSKDETDHHPESITQSPSHTNVTLDGYIDIIENWDGNINKARRENEYESPTTSTTTTTNRFLQRPRLIRNCNRLHQCFAIPRKHWLKQNPNDVIVTDTCSGSIKGIDDADQQHVLDTTTVSKTTTSREWFKKVCGEELVPVYRNPTDNIGATTKDASHRKNHQENDDRVMECPMQTMTIHKYIQDCLADTDDTTGSNSNCDDDKKRCTGVVPYLKDWHFQFWYEQQQQQQRPDGGHEFHYSLPDHLPYDLLNGFLLRFDPLSSSLLHRAYFTQVDDATCVGQNDDKHSRDRNTTTTSVVQYNDYRFVYWGSRNSNTSIHTDVLFSLSWSYNVYGSKLWTFYIPTKSSDDNNSTGSNINDNDVTVVSIEQRTGELMLVPSKMKHSVINQQETISMNHNWITTDILDQVWGCIRTEMIVVDHELSLWDTNWSVTCYSARESMLRGCVGLNVSMYYFMILTRGLDLLRTIVVGIEADDDIYCDLIHIRDALNEIVDDRTIHLPDRLAATLQNDASSKQVVRVGIDCVQFITKVVGLYS